MSNVIEFPDQDEYDEQRKQLLLSEIDTLRQEVEQGYIVNLGIISVTECGEPAMIISNYEHFPALHLALEQLKELTLALEFDES